LEHRPLTDQEIIELCCINMTETYFAIGRGADNSSPFSEDGILGCFSTVRHPAANFAFISAPTAASIQKLKDHTKNSGAFFCYVLPGSHQELAVEMMSFANFTATSELALMFQRKSDLEFYESELEFIDDPIKRFEHTMFLARQFFSNTDLDFLTEISRLTAKSPRCELIQMNSSFCGCMAMESSDCLGLYNVAVSSDKRYRGYGSELIRQCQNLAHQRELNITLQCALNLVPWYERLGLRRYANVVLMRSN
jgi:ribosomal protein S18 acetylase RimI-like enzyme